MIKLFEKIKNTVNDIINFVAKSINNIVIWAFLTAIALGAVTYFVNIPIDYDVDVMVEYRDYIVNKRSLKIHIETCSSVTKMSERNKLKINDSLEHLTSSGYFVCNRCKAGIKRKHEFVASALEGIENILFGDKDISLKSYDEYLNSIEEMGKWYVEHIATYETNLNDIATEKAKEYYKNNKIDRRGNICLYPCDNLKNCAGEYTKAGDDCVRFMFSCLNNMDGNFTNILSKYSKYQWSTISSNLLNTKENQLQYAMTNLGFEIYDIEPQKIDLNNENFGWGKVNNIYPQQTITYIDVTSNAIVCNGEIFNRVYRYVGEN